MASRINTNDMGLPNQLVSLKQLVEFGKQLDWQKTARELDQVQDQSLFDYDTVPEHTTGAGSRSLKKEYQNQLQLLENQLAQKTNDNERLTKLLSQNDLSKSSVTSNNTKILKLKKEKEQLQEAFDKMENKCKYYSTSKKDLEETLKSFQTNISRVTEKKEQYERRIPLIERENEELKKQLSKLQQDFASLKDEHQETQNRLSKLMSTKVTDNNPDIADLSDVNRPNKLAERYSELYDNQWSDAFEALGSDHHDRRKVRVLLNILKEVRQFCEQEAGAQTGNLKNALFTVQNGKPLPDGVNKEIKDIKKAMIPYNVEIMQKRVLESYTYMDSELSSYVRECVNVCWVMVLNDPPIVFGPESRYGDPFDYSMYKTYTRKGDMLDYIVWPALFMSESGALVTKGVAQATQTLKNSVKRPQTAGARGNVHIHGLNESHHYKREPTSGTVVSHSDRDTSSSHYGQSPPYAWEESPTNYTQSSCSGGGLNDTRYLSGSSSMSKFYHSNYGHNYP